MAEPTYPQIFQLRANPVWLTANRKYLCDALVDAEGRATEDGDGNGCQKGAKKKCGELLIGWQLPRGRELDDIRCCKNHINCIKGGATLDGTGLGSRIAAAVASRLGPKPTSGSHINVAVYQSHRIESRISNIGAGNLIKVLNYHIKCLGVGYVGLAPPAIIDVLGKEDFYDLHMETGLFRDTSTQVKGKFIIPERFWYSQRKVSMLRAKKIAKNQYEFADWYEGGFIPAAAALETRGVIPAGETPGETLFDGAIALGLGPYRVKEKDAMELYLFPPALMPFFNADPWRVKETRYEYDYGESGQVISTKRYYVLPLGLEPPEHRAEVEKRLEGTVEMETYAALIASLNTSYPMGCMFIDDDGDVIPANEVSDVDVFVQLTESHFRKVASNDKLMLLLEEKVDQYNGLGLEGQNLLADEIVDELGEEGVRFLVEMDAETEDPVPDDLVFAGLKRYSCAVLVHTLLAEVGGARAMPIDEEHDKILGDIAKQLTLQHTTLNRGGCNEAESKRILRDVVAEHAGSTTEEKVFTMVKKAFPTRSSGDGLRTGRHKRRDEREESDGESEDDDGRESNSEADDSESSSSTLQSL